MSDLFALNQFLDSIFQTFQPKGSETQLPRDKILNKAVLQIGYQPQANHIQSSEKSSSRTAMDATLPTNVEHKYLVMAAETQEVTKPITKRLTDTCICRGARHRVG